eukprot:3932237-Rhodomonas_salina.1
MERVCRRKTEGQAEAARAREQAEREIREREKVGRGSGRGRKTVDGGASKQREGEEAVSYTHLTLPTICSV